MARPLRVEYPGAFYHFFSRGNSQSVSEKNRDYLVDEFFK